VGRTVLPLLTHHEAKVSQEEEEEEEGKLSF